MRADASPFRDKQNAAEKIWLHVEPGEAVHVARQIDAAEMYSVHGASLKIVAALTL
jgi:arginine repressor